jgi:3-phosphoshikimate 1-carboxyvinyltransferase
MLEMMGCQIERMEGTVTLTPSRLTPLDITVPGDVSSAAFGIVAATLVPDSRVTMPDVGMNHTRTGLLEALSTGGASIATGNPRVTNAEPVGELTVTSAVLGAMKVAGSLVPRMIDEFPILAVAATQARGRTVVRDARELRVKESDRVATAVGELNKMGALIEEQEDGFVVHGPTPLRGAEVHSHHDHRLAMALAVAGLVATGETIVEAAECIRDSFPDFVPALRQIGADIEEL